MSIDHNVRAKNNIPLEQLSTSQGIRSSREAQRPFRAFLVKWGPTIGMVIAVVLAWEYVPRILGVKAFIFPPLSEVLGKFFDPVSRSLYISNAGITIFEALGGLAIGASLGILLGFLLGQFPAARRVAYPYIIALQSLPKVAVAPLLVIWFGFGLAPKFIVVILITFFPVLVNTMSGVASVDKDRLDLFRSLSASRLQTWRKLTFPSALPSIMAGLEVAAVMSLLGAIVAEFVSAEAGLGLVLNQQMNNYDTAGSFAVLMILSLIGITLNQSIAFIRRRALKWSVTNDGGK